MGTTINLLNVVVANGNLPLPWGMLHGGVLLQTTESSPSIISACTLVIVAVTWNGQQYNHLASSIPSLTVLSAFYTAFFCLAGS